jgi:hypothetical protein
MLSPVELAPHTWDGSRSASEPGHSLLDALMPTWDATRVEWCLVTAPPCVVYNTAIGTDLLDVVREHRAVRALFAARAGLERAASLVRLRRAPAPEPASMRLRDLPHEGEWILLGSAPRNEITFGAVGRFWAGETRWETIDAPTFETFDRPGFAKIGCNLLLRSLEDGRTAIAYEARTRATDDAARRAFRRYWLVASPFVGVVMRSTLGLIARRSLEAAGERTSRPA